MSDQILDQRDCENFLGLPKIKMSDQMLDQSDQILDQRDCENFLGLPIKVPEGREPAYHEFLLEYAAEDSVCPEASVLGGLVPVDSAEHRGGFRCNGCPYYGEHPDPENRGPCPAGKLAKRTAEIFDDVNSVAKQGQKIKNVPDKQR